MLDQFSRHIQAELSADNGQTWPTLKHHLRIALGTVVGTTYATERLHSQTLRKTKSRTMTHDMTISEVAAALTGQTAPPFGAGICKQRYKDIQLQGQSLSATSLHPPRGSLLKTSPENSFSGKGIYKKPLCGVLLAWLCIKHCFQEPVLHRNGPNPCPSQSLCFSGLQTYLK